MADSDWVEIIEADLKTLLTEHEWTALTTVTREPAANGVVPTVIARITNKVRGYVVSCEQNRLGPEGTVPAILMDAALILCLEALCASVPAAGITMDEARRELRKNAQEELKMVACCKLKIMGPGSGQEVPADSPAPDGGGWGGECAVNFSGVR